MTQERDKDSEFEAYLQGKSGLSDLYADLPQARLPEHLDAAILAEAHRAVHARPGGKPRRSWVIPLSMAASLFVAVIIGAQLRYLLPVDRSAQPPASEPPGPAMQPAAPKTENAKEMAPERSPAGELKMKKQATAAPAPAAAPREEAAVSQETRDKASTRANKKAEAYESKQVLGEQAAPAAAAAAPPAAPPPEVQTEAAPTVAGESPPQNTQAAPEGNAPRRKAKKAQEPAESDARVSRQFAPAAPPVAAASAPVAGVPQAAMADTANLRPEDWLARIRKLKQQGKLDEAKKELAAFRKRYPAYTVPKDLEMR